MKIEITEKISYLKAEDDPLSADVVFIEDEGITWIFDVGTNQQSREEINNISGTKNIVLSHFHPDHIANIFRVKYDNLYIGDNTAKYVTTGTVIKEKFNSGNIELYPIPSSHAKGSLILKCGEYAFLGDATYVAYKKNGRCYNVQKLNEEISFLKNLNVNYLCLSHDRNFVRDKSSVLGLLESIYSMRKGKEPFIYM